MHLKDLRTQKQLLVRAEMKVSYCTHAHTQTYTLLFLVSNYMYIHYMLVGVWALGVWGELVPSKIFNPPFPVLRLGIQCPTLIYVMFVWSGVMGWVSFCFFLQIPVWLVCYAHVVDRLCLGREGGRGERGREGEAECTLGNLGISGPTIQYQNVLPADICCFTNYWGALAP